MVQPNDTFLFDLEQFFSGGNYWQAGLWQQVDGLTLEQVLWKPAQDRHSIWQVLLHINFWKTVVIATLRNTPRPDATTGDWSVPPDNPTEVDWKKELERTRTLQGELSDEAKKLGENLFDTTEKKSNYIRQLICHDAYHTGQIGLLRVMQGIKAIEV
jgi:uncharacterized damage-inducible protein DinB